MPNSAVSLRERRLTQTAKSLMAEARRLASTRGFGGFTIEELCSQVGVSRRTFFNYYASKENAILGIAVRSDTSDLDEAFVDGRGDVLDDLAELCLARWERQSLTKTEAEELGRIFDREPRLYTHFVQFIAEGERDDIALARRRPDITTDLAAETAVLTFGSLVRPAVVAYFAEDGTDFRTHLIGRLDAARSLFTH